MSDEGRSTDRLDAAPWRGLLATATQVGVYSWLERRLFEVLGAWSLTETEPATKVRFDEWSHRHAWHASVLFDRLPELREVDADALIVPPDARIASLVDEIAAAASTAERLVGLHRVVVPRLVEAYRSERAGRTDVADASLRHWLGLLVTDLEEEQRVGLAWLDELLVDPAVAAAADRLRAALEAAWAGWGGLTA